MSKFLNLDSLRKAVSSLSDSLDLVNDRSWFENQSDKLQKALIAGVIQNFEFVYEISVKMIKRQIEAESISPEDIDHSNYRNMLRTAGETGLIADVKAWFKYREVRNKTSHTYDQEKAKEVYTATLNFIIDARSLLKTLEARNE